MEQLLIFLFFLLLPIQFGKHFWPNFSIVAGQRVDYLSPTVYATDIVSLFIILCWFSKNRKKIQSLFTPYHLFTVSIFFLFLGIGIFLSNNPMSGWYVLIKLVEYLLLGIALKDYLSNRKYLLYIVSGFGLGVLLESILALWQFALQSSVGGLWYFLGERTFTADTPGIANVSLNGQLLLRPYGTLPHPNVLAGYLLLAMIFISVYKFLLPSRWYRMLISLIVFLGTVTLLITFNRSAIVLWILFLTYYTYIFFSKKIKQKTLLIIAMAVYLLTLSFLLFATPLGLRFFSLSTSDESIVFRWALMQAAWSMFIAHPFFGVGLGNFLHNLPSFLSLPTPILLIQPVHNIFLLILAETGLPGLLFFLWFVIKTIIQNQKQKIKDDSRERFSVSAKTISITMIILLGLLDHYFLTLQQGQLLITFVFAYAWSFL